METNHESATPANNGGSSPKKTYKTPVLTEYGIITNLVNRRLLNGTDGGLPVDNDT